ncbi:MAG: O-antigen ligase family protein [Microgenomates group bacterium]|nr:O-antigen ligase family protein [Microgenomates group bacterium]
MLKINKILSYLYYSLFFFTPLIMFSKTSELFEFNKMIFIYLMTILIIFLWCLKMILYKKIILKKTPLDIFIIIFLATEFISTVFSIDVHTSIFGYYGRFNGGFLSIISYIILYYGLTTNIGDFPANFINRLLKISLISSFLVILWGLPGKFGYDLSCFLFVHQLNNNCWTDQFRPSERMFSTLGQPNWLGAYLAINFFIGSYYFIKSRLEGKNKFIDSYFLYLFLNFCTILFTRSRSALVAVLVCLSFLFSFLFYEKFFCWIKLKNFIIAFLIILILPTIFFKTGIEKIDHLINLSTYKNFIFKKNQTIEKKSLPTRPSGVTESFDIRKIVWQGAIDLGFKYPLFGTGVETFAYSYYFVRPASHNLTSEWDYLYNKAHNEYLNYLATTGFIGLGAYLILITAFVFFIFRSIKEKNFNKSQMIDSKLKIVAEKNYLLSRSLLIFCLFLAWLTILITNFFGFSTSTINLFFYLIPAIIIGVTKESYLTDKSKNIDFKNLNKNQKIQFYLLLFLSIYAFLFIIFYWLADIQYSAAEVLSHNNEYQRAIKNYDNALKLHYEHVYQDKISYALANLAFYAAYQKQVDLALTMRKLAESFNNLTVQASPKNVLYWKTKAKNQYLFYQISLIQKDLELGVEALQQAKKLAPTDPKIDYSLALYYSLIYDEEKKPMLKLDNQKKALQAVDRAIDLKADYRDAYFLKGQLLKKFGAKEEAKKTWQYILDKISPEDAETKKELENF